MTVAIEFALRPLPRPQLVLAVVVVLLVVAIAGQLLALTAH